MLWLLDDAIARSDETKKHSSSERGDDVVGSDIMFLAPSPLLVRGLRLVSTSMVDADE